MEFKRKQSTFCDSGYNSLDLDESKDDKQENSHAEKAANVDDEEEEESFSDWLKKVAKCLGSRPNTEKYRNIVEKEESEDEGARCMRIVRSVLDEKTVLEMTKDYLHYAKDTAIPDHTKVIFQSCELDRDTGAFVLRAYINCYMLSKVRKANTAGVNISQNSWIFHPFLLVLERVF